VIACAAVAGGCQRDTTLINWAEAPDVSVTGVELVSLSDEGASAAIELDLNSGAEVALPLTLARYTVELNGQQYRGDVEPNAVLPAGRSLTVRLPAAVSGAPGDRYSVRGRVEYEPPGQVRKVLTDLGVPLPSTGFSGEGELAGEPRRVEDVPTRPVDAAEKPGSEEARELSGVEEAPADADLPKDPEDLVPEPDEAPEADAGTDPQAGDEPEAEAEPTPPATEP
jgi:hypothetical protein